jgi:2-methylcitrate dehydratase
LYLVCTKLRKALEMRAQGYQGTFGFQQLMLTPHDFAPAALKDARTKALMAKMSFEHGGKEYDDKYPDGIPTSIVITDAQGKVSDSGLVMYPGGHARNHLGPDKIDLHEVLRHKFRTLAKLAAEKPDPLIARMTGLEKKSAGDVAAMLDFPLQVGEAFD